MQWSMNTSRSLGSHYSDTEAVIPRLTNSESESEDEDEDSFNALPTTSTDSSATSGFALTPSDLNTRTGKDGTVWSSFLSPQGRIRSHNIITQGYTEFVHQTFTLQTTLFRSFLVKTSLKKLCCVQTCRVDGFLRNGMLYQKTTF